MKSFIILFLFSQSVLASDLPDYCSLNSPQPDEVIPSDHVSGNYWTNMLDDHTVMFTAGGGVSGDYQAYDLNEKKAYKLTTEIDPFPVPDGRRVYVHPSPIQFFEYDTILKKVNEEGKNQSDLVNTDGYSPINDNKARAKYIKKGEPEIEDDSIDKKLGDIDGRMWGYYQSVAVLESSKIKERNFSRYRILTGEGEGAFKDYKVNFNDDGTIKMVESETKAKAMCPNYRNSKKNDLDFDTPIISPKGDEFAVTDRKTKTTKILKFKKSGVCEVVLDLGFDAGKIHFSKDGSKIAFHTQNLNMGSTKTTTKNNRGFLIDRKDNSIMSLQVGAIDEETSEQYPVFLDDGRILYQRVKYDRASGKQSRSWVKVDPKKLNAAKFQKVNKEDCLQDKNLPLIAIGKLYSEICKIDRSANDNIIWTLNLDPEKCKELVRNNWEDTKKEILLNMKELNKSNSSKEIPDDFLTKEMLLAACPERAPEKLTLVNSSEGTKMRYPVVISERCIVCHTEGSPNGYIPFDKPEEMRMIKAIGDSAKPGRPFFGKTFFEQMTTILEYSEEGKTPPQGIPAMPAVGPRLNANQLKEIKDWITNGHEVN